MFSLLPIPQAYPWLSLLITKFGWNSVSTTASIINSLPKVLTKKQFSAFSERTCTEQGVVLSDECVNTDQIARLLQDQGSEFIKYYD